MKFKLESIILYERDKYAFNMLLKHRTITQQLMSLNGKMISTSNKCELEGLKLGLFMDIPALTEPVWPHHPAEGFRHDGQR